MLKSILKGSPRNIRKRFFRDILLVILISSGSLFALILFFGQSIKDDISSQVIGETGELARNRFLSYLDRFAISLMTVSELGQSALIGTGDNTQTEKMLSGIFNVHEDVYEIVLLNKNTKHLELVREGDSYSTRLNTTLNFTELVQSDFFNKALSAPAEPSVYWSDSFTVLNGKKGLAASIRVNQLDQQDPSVLIYFIPVEKIVSFIADIEVDQNIEIVLFNESGHSLSQRPSGKRRGEGTITESAEQVATGYLEPDDIIDFWEKRDDRSHLGKKLIKDGIPYWVGCLPLTVGVNSPWLAVVVPESAIVTHVNKRRSQLWVIGIFIFVLAMGLTVNLARKYSYKIKDIPHQNMIRSEVLANTQALIKAGESSTVEFKSTVRHNIKTDKRGKEIELAWLKALVSFMNSDGGILLLGVNDDGEITGIEYDGFANEDKCRLHIKNLINTHIGTELAKYAHLRFCTIDSKTVLAVECERVRKPVFLRVGKNEDFFIRSGPSSMKLSMSQMVSYLAER